MVGLDDRDVECLEIIERRIGAVMEGDRERRCRLRPSDAARPQQSRQAPTGAERDSQAALHASSPNAMLRVARGRIIHRIPLQKSIDDSNARRLEAGDGAT